MESTCGALVCAVSPRVETLLCEKDLIQQIHTHVDDSLSGTGCGRQPETVKSENFVVRIDDATAPTNIVVGEDAFEQSVDVVANQRVQKRRSLSYRNPCLGEILVR